MSTYFYYAALIMCSPYFPIQKQTLNIKNMDFLLLFLQGQWKQSRKVQNHWLLYVFNLQQQKQQVD